MKAKSFTISASFPSSAETVFAAITEPRHINRWSKQRGKVEPMIGGRIELFNRLVKGKVLAYQPGKRLSFTWKPSGWATEVQATVVICLFKRTRTGTKLILKHNGFSNQDELRNHKTGWVRFVFNPLKMYLLNM